MVRHAPLGVAVRVSYDIAQSAHMANLVLRGAVVQVQGVPMRPGGLAAVREVGLLVHMEAVLGARLAKVLDVPGDGDGVRIELLERHHAGAGLLRLRSIARLAVWPDNTRRFQRKGGHGLVCNCNSLVESLYHILYCMQDMVRNNDKLLKIPTLHRISDI